MSVHYWIFL